MIVARGVGLRMLRTVVLRHSQPDGSSHYDWMLEHPDRLDERRLRTWRTEVRPDRAAAFAGEQIGDHRAIYLEYEGDLGGGRGQVARVASGWVCWDRCGQDSVVFEVAWADGRKGRFEGENWGGSGWWFVGSEQSPST